MALNPFGRLTMAVLSAVLFCGVIATPGLAQTPPVSTTPSSVPADYAGKPYNDAPFEVPCTIPAWQYDISPNAKMDVTFHYGSPAQKDTIRKSGDSIRCTTFGGGHFSTKGVAEDAKQVYMGWTQTGEWMKYSIHVNDAGAYQFGGKFAAAGADAKLSVTITPDTKGTTFTLPTTAGFQPGVEVYHVWEVVDSLGDVTLPAGNSIMTVKIENAGGMNICNFSLTKKGATTPPVTTPPVTTPPVTTPPVTTPPATTAASSVPADYVGKPYNDAPFEIPGTIQAWQYDISPDKKNDVTFHYNGGIGGNIRKSGDGISVTGFGGSHVNIYNVPEDPSQIYLGWTQPGQWMKYTVHVKEAGAYVIGGHYACGENPGATLSFSFTPDIVVKDFTLPTTVGFVPGWETYHVWETVDNQAEVTLPAGTCVMTVKFVTWGGLNAGYYTLHKKGEALPPVTTGTAVTGKAPDLVITKVTWDPPAPKAGDAVTFSAVVKNQGTAPTTDGIVLGLRFIVDTNPAVIWSDNDTSALAPGKEVTLTATGGTAGATWTATTGTHAVNALVDDVNRFAETDETNNLLKATITIP